MANHSYVTMTQAISTEQADSLLREVLLDLFGTTFRVVEREDLNKPWKAAQVWFVSIPGSAPAKDPTQPEDYGFLVFLQENSSVWEFRHPLNRWERWAQARFYHTLAHKLNCDISDDGIATSFSARPEYLDHATFFDFVTRHLPKPLDAGNRAWGMRQVNDFEPPQLRKTTMTVDELGQKGYSAYGDSVGWKNYLGLPMPTWEALPVAIQQAWRDAASAMFGLAMAAQITNANEVLDKLHAAEAEIEDLRELLGE